MSKLLIMKPQSEDRPMKSEKEIAQIKGQIKFYFSDELQHDESIVGALKRNQIVRNLLNWAKENK